MPTKTITLINQQGKPMCQVTGDVLTIDGIEFVLHRMPDAKGKPNPKARCWGVSDPVTGTHIARDCATKAAATSCATEKVSTAGGAAAVEKAQAGWLARRAKGKKPARVTH